MFIEPLFIFSLQSLKRFTFPFFRVFTMRLQCARLALTVRSLALPSPFALTFRKALTVRSQIVQLALTVRSAFS